MENGLAGEVQHNHDAGKQHRKRQGKTSNNEKTAQCVGVVLKRNVWFHHVRLR